ncbi:MAG: hypothetical protein H6662_19190 [Ardenticatenaceae bacterium]|nr:hypothetical protein [Ardenticatenaceae bacterium]
MFQKIKNPLVFSGVLLILFMGMAPVFAQEPRPTPTMAPIAQDTPTRPTETPVPPTATPELQNHASAAEPRGTIRGMVYEDVDGDGRCINTNISGENPVANIPIEFVSSDEQTVINLSSGPDGGYGLVAAGLSYWAVTARPGSEWVVTSEETQYAPVYEDSLVVTDVNFCVQKASSARVLLPVSGGAGTGVLLFIFLLVGFLLIFVGISFEIRQKNA